MFVEGFNRGQKRYAAPRRTFGQQLATTATVKQPGPARPNRQQRRRQLALAPRSIRMQVRATKRAWIPPHPLCVEQYMDAPAYEAYAEKSGEEQAAIYRTTKNMLKRRRRAQCV